MTDVFVRMSRSLLEWHSGGREKVALEAVCRMCQLGDPRVPTRHHLVPQSWFKTRVFYEVSRPGRLLPRHRIRDCDANIMPLCVQCHIAVENPDDDSARRMLRKMMGQNEVAFVIQLVGRVWLDERYPQSAASSLEEERAEWRKRAETRRTVVERPKKRLKRVPSGLQHRRECRPGACVVDCPVWIEHGAAALQYGYQGREVI